MAQTTKAVDRELGAGAWSYFGDPRAISHDGHTFTGWISTVRQRVGRSLHEGRQAQQATDLQRPRARRSQQPVARLPARRAHRGVLLAALGSPPASPWHSERDALHGLVAPILDRGLRAGENGPDQRPRRPGLHVSEPGSAQGQAVAVLARRRVESDLLLHRRRHEVGAGPRARLLRPRAAALREVRRRRGPPHPRHLHRRPPDELEEQPALPPLRGRVSTTSAGAGSAA